MNTFTRSSIELISTGVYSGNSCPTTRCFLFFGFGFHTAIESLYYYRKASLKYIRTIFRNLFYRDSIRQSLTPYKLSKNNISYIMIISHFFIVKQKNNIRLSSPPFRTGTSRRWKLNFKLGITTWGRGKKKLDKVFISNIIKQGYKIYLYLWSRKSFLNFLMIF